MPLDATAFDPAGTALHANTTGRAYVVMGDGSVMDLGPVSFDGNQKGSVTLPRWISIGKTCRVAVVFDDTPLMWDTATVRASARAGRR